MKIIGITGGIASGKSTISDYLTQKGFTVIDGDKLSRVICEPNEPGWKAIFDGFGTQYFRSDGTLDRKKLGSYVFSDEKALDKLNSIIHPLIINKTLEIIGEHKNEKLVFVDGALLIESGLYKHCDELLLVTADDDIRLERIIKRDKVSIDEAEKRMTAQMSEDEKKKYATHIIDNSLSRENTFIQVDNFLSLMA